MAADTYDYYLVMENDMNVSAVNLEYLCTTWAFLGPSPPTANETYLPTLLRYEIKSEHDPHKWLAEFNYISGPQVSEVVTVKGRAFVRPAEQFSAMWFLPASRLKAVLEELTSNTKDAKGWRSRSFVRQAASLVREWHAGMWLNHVRFVPVVPVDSFDASLVHHMSDRYVRRGTENPFGYYVDSRAVADAVGRYNNTPIFCHTEYLCHDFHAYLVDQLNDTTITPLTKRKFKEFHVVLNGTKRMVPNMDTYNAMKLGAKAAAKVLPPNLYDAIPKGPDLPSLDFP